MNVVKIMSVPILNNHTRAHANNINLPYYVSFLNKYLDDFKTFYYYKNNTFHYIIAHFSCHE
ncbi:hypothetical protein ECANGB1_1048 [Enterospora canceri]|uniref:Uncharacterized protein n=1 Tax=Enterospora canceri TaxID=1081671 RepID=A0A1Y1S7Z3_9MICR|nr:hypothetical protein ECANGB1_1240 [Enterospora canceri]ORD94146.1 hypothetical protein ECANGB1_1048 [Enterospora canceri]